jgi:hypothetical protein
MPKKLPQSLQNDAENVILSKLNPEKWRSNLSIAMSLMEGQGKADHAAFKSLIHGHPSARMTAKMSISTYDKLDNDSELVVLPEYEFVKADLEEAVLSFREEFGHIPGMQLAERVVRCDAEAALAQSGVSQAIKTWRQVEQEASPVTKLAKSALSNVGVFPSRRPMDQWEDINRVILGNVNGNTAVADEQKVWLNLLSEHHVTDCRNLIFYRLKTL